MDGDRYAELASFEAMGRRFVGPWHRRRTHVGRQPDPEHLAVAGRDDRRRDRDLCRRVGAAALVGTRPLVGRGGRS